MGPGRRRHLLSYLALAMVIVGTLAHALPASASAPWRGRQIDLVFLIGFIVGARTQIGVVRLHEGDAQHERPLVTATRMLMEPSLRRVGDVVIVLHLEKENELYRPLLHQDSVDHHTRRRNGHGDD